jgi:hypothetical protein
VLETKLQALIHQLATPLAEALLEATLQFPVLKEANIEVRQSLKYFIINYRTVF